MKFRIANIIALMAVVVLAWVHYSIMPIHRGYFVILACVYGSIVFIGCVRLRSGFFMPVKWRGDRHSRLVALSFDDGPNATYTPLILDTLKKQEVPASFFCIGRHIAENEALLQQINDEGHIIGNHSYTHDFWFDMLSSTKMLEELEAAGKAIADVIGRKPALFRPPYGVMNPNLKKAIKKGKYTPVGWSIRTFDTAAKDKQKLLLRILNGIKGGDVILLHDSMEITATILPELVERIRSKGFEIAPLDKVLNVAAYA